MKEKKEKKISIRPKPIGKVKISKIFVNKTTGQMTIILPKRKMKIKNPKKAEVSYW